MDFFVTINSWYVFVGASLLGACGGLLGSFAVLRRQGLLGDALAHSALPGIAVAFLLMQTKFLPGLLLGALVSGLLGVGLIYFLVFFSKIKMEAAMAAVLSTLFGLGVMLLTYLQKLPFSSKSGLDTFLFGSAAGLLREDVLFLGGIFIFVVLVVLSFFKELKLLIFDRNFAVSIGMKVKFLDFVFMLAFVLAILISLQAVGVILTAGIFITPAACALLLCKRMEHSAFWATVFGAFSGGVGTILSTLYEGLPTGPVIVLVTSFLFMIVFVFSPRRGVLWKWLSGISFRRKVERENVLGALARAFERGNYRVKVKQFKKSVVNGLRCQGLVCVEDGNVFLTDQGKSDAVKVVEKHRLWEAYLVYRFHLSNDHVHRDAEDMEHVLTDEIVLELKNLMKNPRFDPHGKPIRINI